MDFQREIQKVFISISDSDKAIAYKILNDYQRQGKTPRFIYLAFLQLKGRSVEKYRYLMFNQKFLQQIWKQYLWSVADDLDGVLFNGWASKDDLRTIERWIDIEAYNRAERGFCESDRGNVEKYHSDVVDYLFQLLSKMNEVDVNTIERIINDSLRKEGE